MFRWLQDPGRYASLLIDGPMGAKAGRAQEIVMEMFRLLGNSGRSATRQENVGRFTAVHAQTLFTYERTGAMPAMPASTEVLRDVDS